MDLYGSIAFAVGVGIAAFIWTPNNNYIGEWVYRLYLCYFRKNTRLKMLIAILDSPAVYTSYKETFSDRKISYLNYMKVVGAYEPRAMANLRRFSWINIYYYCFKKNYFIVYLSISFYLIPRIHFQLLGMAMYFALRYIYYYIEYGRRNEPYFTLSVLSFLAEDEYMRSKKVKSKKKTTAS